MRSGGAPAPCVGSVTHLPIVRELFGGVACGITSARPEAGSLSQVGAGNGHPEIPLKVSFITTKQPWAQDDWEVADVPRSGSQHRRPHAPPMAGSFLEFDLKRDIEQVHREPDWNTGQNARTLVKYHDLRVVLI